MTPENPGSWLVFNAKINNSCCDRHCPPRWQRQAGKTIPRVVANPSAPGVECGLAG